MEYEGYAIIINPFSVFIFKIVILCMDNETLENSLDNLLVLPISLYSLCPP